MPESPLNIKRILVVGAGTMGQQIGAHCLLNGFDVVVYDTNPEALDGAADELAKQAAYFDRWKDFTPHAVAALRKLRIETDLERAAQGCDLVIETVPERLRVKKEVFAELNRICSPHTIFTTNTSSMLPSLLADSTGRPSRFAALHFFPFSFVAEVMGHPRTDPEVLEQLESFTLAIKHIPVRCHKEQQGHVFNTMYMALISTAISLAADGVASVHDIDRCWVEATEMPLGPFASLDFVGLDTAFDVMDFLANIQGDEQSRRNAEFLHQYVDGGRLGAKTNQGFYDYPNPLYKHPLFLKPVRMSELTASAESEWSVLKSVDSTTPGEVTAKLTIDPKTCAFVRDHCFKETPLFPMSATIEILRCVLQQVRPEWTAIELRDFKIDNGLRFFTDRSASLVLKLVDRDDGVAATLTHDYYNRAGKLVQANRPLVRAFVAPAPPTQLAVAPTAVGGSLFEVGYRSDATIATLGPSMRCLERLWLEDRSGAGEVRCNGATDAGATLHDVAVAAFDAALIACHGYTQQRLQGGLQLASTADVIRLGRSPAADERCRVGFVVKELGEKDSTFDVALYGADGETLLAIEGYHCTVLASDEPPLTLTTTHSAPAS